MIRIKNTVTKEEQIITPTIFPDGTSQVWKIGIEKYIYNHVMVIWNFENEAELIHLIQLIHLLGSYNIVVMELYIPYFPYSRQDKNISDTTTFAKRVFVDLLAELPSVYEITSLDIHSDIATRYKKSYSAIQYVNKAIDDFNPTVLVFPDAGAHTRYSHYSGFSTFDCIVLDKDREQSSGNIGDLKINEEKTKLSSKYIGLEDRMLIIDDICDGGATFIKASKFLHDKYKCKIGLYVTHGIFSKGKDIILDSGIEKIYTTQSLIKNTEGFELNEF